MNKFELYRQVRYGSSWVLKWTRGPFRLHLHPDYPRNRSGGIERLYQIRLYGHSKLSPDDLFKILSYRIFPWVCIRGFLPALMVALRLMYRLNRVKLGRIEKVWHRAAVRLPLRLP